MNSAETFTFQTTQMKNGQDHYQAVWPWVRCSPSLILGSHVCKWDNNIICYPTPRWSPFLMLWSQPPLAPEAKALITLVSPFVGQECLVSIPSHLASHLFYILDNPLPPETEFCPRLWLFSALYWGHWWLGGRWGDTCWMNTARRARLLYFTGERGNFHSPCH